MLSSKNTLKIHAWGGLGSQLFAISLANHLSNRFQLRKFIIVLHSSGVTRRIPEVIELYPEFTFEVNEDFVPTSTEGRIGTISSLNKFARRIARTLLLRVRLIASCDDDFETKRVKPWTFQIRGHYSYRTVGDDFLLDLYSRIVKKRKFLDVPIEEMCVVHYRLGDLLVLNEKRPIVVDDIVGEFNKRFIGRWINPTLLVFSDSPREAGRRIQLSLKVPVLAPNADSLEVLLNSSNAGYFIGTASKLSFWIVAIRHARNLVPGSIPDNNLPQIVNLISGRCNTVNTY